MLTLEPAANIEQGGRILEPGQGIQGIRASGHGHGHADGGLQERWQCCEWLGVAPVDAPSMQRGCPVTP